MTRWYDLSAMVSFHLVVGPRHLLSAFSLLKDAELNTSIPKMFLFLNTLYAITKLSDFVQ